MANDNETQVGYENRDGVVFITLNRPEKHNAITDDMMRQLKQAMQRFDLDQDAYVAVLHGAGQSFTSGADVKQRQLRPREEREQFGLWSPDTRKRDLMYDYVNWKPVIAATHGYALGAGLAMALRCDLLVASSDTRFQVTEVARGLTGGTLWAIMHFRGAGSFADEACITGRFFSGQEARDAGLATRSVSPQSHLEVAEELARDIMKLPPLSVRQAVRVRRCYMEEHERQAILFSEPRPPLYLSEDFERSAQAFVNKKAMPEFEGK